MTVMLLEWVITSAFLILTVLALRAAFGKQVSARMRYALWAVVLVRLLVPVQLFTSPLAGTRVFSESRTEQNIYKATDKGLEKGTPDDILALGTPDGPSVTLFNPPQAPSVPDAPEPPAAPDLTRASGVLGWIWLGGSAAMALVLTASNLRFARRLRRRRIPVEGTDCPLRVYEAVGLPSPCLFGLARPAVYVTPEAAADPVMLRHVVTHEYTHFRHGDHIWSFLRCAALAAHWWNPLVWLAVTLSRRDGELACDEGALRRLGDGERMAYGNTLLALVTAKPGPGELLCFATTMAGDKKSLKERVSRIACAPKRIIWAAATVVLVTVLACACAFGQAAEPDAPEDDPAPVPTASPAVTEPPAPDGEHTADLNRNGVPETLRVSGTSEKMLLEVWENDKLIFSEEAYHSHAGYNALFLCRLDGEDYLLRYHPYTAQGGASYTYELFTLSKDGEEQAARENSMEFYINLVSPVAWNEPFIGSFDPEKIAAFMDEINGLLANSVQLINTDSELLDTFRKEGRLYDSLWWLDGFGGKRPFVQDGGTSLLESLRDYQASMEGAVEYKYWMTLMGYSNFTLRVPSMDIETEHEYSANIADVPAVFDPNDTYMKLWNFAVVDMDGDGTNEVLVYACGVAGDMGGYLLLHQMNGNVYGMAFNSTVSGRRWFEELKTDGTFKRRDPLGTDWMSITRLRCGAVYYIDDLAIASSSDHGDYDSFLVDHQEAARAEFEAVVAEQDAKPDAVWFDFDEENINVVFRS